MSRVRASTHPPSLCSFCEFITALYVAFFRRLRAGYSVTTCGASWHHVVCRPAGFADTTSSLPCSNPVCCPPFVCMTHYLCIYLQVYLSAPERGYSGLAMIEVRSTFRFLSNLDSWGSFTAHFSARFSMFWPRGEGSLLIYENFGRWCCKSHVHVSFVISYTLAYVLVFRPFFLPVPWGSDLNISFTSSAYLPVDTSSPSGIYSIYSEYSEWLRGQYTLAPPLLVYSHRELCNVRFWCCADRRYVWDSVRLWVLSWSGRSFSFGIEGCHQPPRARQYGLILSQPFVSTSLDQIHLYARWLRLASMYVARLFNTSSPSWPHLSSPAQWQRLFLVPLDPH